jgi:hypothetical protein
MGAREPVSVVTRLLELWHVLKNPPHGGLVELRAKLGASGCFQLLVLPSHVLAEMTSRPDDADPRARMCADALTVLEALGGMAFCGRDLSEERLRRIYSSAVSLYDGKTAGRLSRLGLRSVGEAADSVVRRAARLRASTIRADTVAFDAGPIQVFSAKAAWGHAIQRALRVVGAKECQMHAPRGAMHLLQELLLANMAIVDLSQEVQVPDGFSPCGEDSGVPARKQALLLLHITGDITASRSSSNGWLYARIASIDARIGVILAPFSLCDLVLHL